MVKAGKYQLSLYLDKRLVDRADALVASISQDAKLSAFGVVSKSNVLRLALAEGLDVLEARYLSGKKGRGK